MAPGVVAVLVPSWISHWQMQPAFFGSTALRVIGIVLLIGGVPIILDSFARFALQGLGTPAPVLPTEHLVVTGLYRYVRNPMYVGVTATTLGQGLLFGNVRVLEYGVIVWLAFHLFVLGFEEPQLRSTFGDEYREFFASVPRWIPRLTAWKGPDRSQSRQS
jgi:protein-S-isoprenylcysteine O-methyltransferase Ste14